MISPPLLSPPSANPGPCRGPASSRDSKSNKRFFTFHRPAGEAWEGRGGGGPGGGPGNLVHSRTMDLGGRRGPPGGQGDRRGGTVERRTGGQEDFLPRHAWTEEEEWGEPPDLVRGNTTSTSDITVSPSSSESYPECRF